MLSGAQLAQRVPAQVYSGPVRFVSCRVARRKGQRRTGADCIRARSFNSELEFVLTISLVFIGVTLGPVENPCCAGRLFAVAQWVAQHGRIDNEIVQ